MSIMPVSCSICGGAHPRWECPKWEVPARGAHRPRGPHIWNEDDPRVVAKPDLSIATSKPALQTPNGEFPMSDAAGSAARASSEPLRAMSDAELKVCYNAVMAEYMRRRRAKQKAT
jgi:hypothetical protein